MIAARAKRITFEYETITRPYLVSRLSRVSGPFEARTDSFDPRHHNCYYVILSRTRFENKLKRGTESAVLAAIGFQ